MGSVDHPPFLRSVRLRDDAPTTAYPFQLPAIEQLDLTLGTVTVLVGDNGSGKSTLIEALAVAADFNPEGGSRNLRFETFATHSDLHAHLELRWRQRPRWGWFLRAETFYGMATRITTDDDPAGGLAGIFPGLHDRSHGQSFLSLIESRFTTAGLYLMDEPESALSFQGQLQLLRVIHDGVAAGAQFILATHSPILMRATAATIYELDDDGVRQLSYDDVTAVGLWRRFLDEPDRLLQILYRDDDPDDTA